MNDIPGISGWGFYLPNKKVSVEELGKKAGLPEIVTRYIGSKYVYEADENELPSDMCIKAAVTALENAGINASSVDLIINAPAGMQDYVLPPLSGKIQHGVGADNAACFDVSQGCCGMFTGLHIAKNFILNKVYKNVLVVSGDKWSSYTKYHTADAVIFGDGAGAVIVSEKSNNFSLKDFLFITKGKYYNLWGLKDSGVKYFNKKVNDNLYKCLEPDVAKSEFKDIYAPLFIDIAKKILNKNMLKTTNVAFLNMVNANRRLLEMIAKELEIPMEKTCDKYLVENGHIGGFDNFLNIYEAFRDGLIKKGDIILNLTAGIGFTWGASIIEF